MFVSLNIFVCLLALHCFTVVYAGVGQSSDNVTTFEAHFGPGPECHCPNQPVASLPDSDPCTFCANLQCDNNFPPLPDDIIEDCKSCSDPFARDCFCTKNFHPRGCTIKECGAEDGIAPPDLVFGYTCYCNDVYKPLHCVSRSNPSNPRCPDVVPPERIQTQGDCQCNSVTGSPDNCNIRVCDPDELTGDGNRCVCGPGCDQKPDGCVKELTFGSKLECDCPKRSVASHPDACNYCSTLLCDNSSNQDNIEDCGSCSDPFTKDCFCNKKYHQKGCTLKDCGPEDGFTRDDTVVGYTCYCNEAHHPFDCVSRSNTAHPLCPATAQGMGGYRDDCQCDTETSDPDNCNIRVCNPDELTGDGYHCLCGPRCDQKPDGCVKELPL